MHPYNSIWHVLVLILQGLWTVNNSDDSILNKRQNLFYYTISFCRFIGQDTVCDGKNFCFRCILHKIKRIKRKRDEIFE